MSKIVKHILERDLSGTKKPSNDKRFANNCFITGPLNPKAFQLSHSDFICAMEMSNDESFIVVGGRHEGNGQILMWKTADAFGIESELKPSAVVHSEQYHDVIDNIISSVAISPDKGRIFSGWFNQRILIHDNQRAQLLHSIPEEDHCVLDVSVQPDSYKGDIFAAASGRVLSIFDIRRNTTDSVIKMEKEVCVASMVAFSPVQTNQLAVGGECGSNIIDIRQPNQDLLLLSSGWCIRGIRYNSEGNRLIFMEQYAGPHVIDLLTLNNGDENEWKKKLDRQVDRYWALGTCCFAGANDELVVATSSHHKDLYVWSVPNGRFNTIVLDQPRRLPSGKQWITAMGYSKHRSSLIACYNVGSNGDIKVWCPFRLPQLPH